jgi:transcriptional regulator with XRE-family HTH domain
MTTRQQGKLARKIRYLREQAEISQEELARKLGLNRPSLSQIERGERKVTADELVRFGKLFRVSVDSLLDLEKAPEVVLEEREESVPKTPPLRINIPQENVAKFKETLLYILNKVGAKPNIGETVIYKLLYFIDFDFYEKYEEQFIGATYIKNKYGPTPTEFKKIVDRMITDGEVEKIRSKHFKYPQTKYLAVRFPKIEILRAHELKMIDDVLRRHSDKNASEISDYSHKDVPWMSTREGTPIEYESVFYRTPLYSVRQYE